MSLNNISASDMPSSESPAEPHSSVANGPTLVYLDGSDTGFGQENMANILSPH